jgi:predicted nucleic acid-binding protein
MERSKIEGSFVLDSSVVIKWFSEEEDTSIALQFREQYTKGLVTIAVPDLIVYEIANALRYNKNLNEKDVKDSIGSIMSMDLDIVVPTKNVVESAISTALEHDVTVYDAYFIALAKALKYTFVTADEKLYQKIKKLNFVKLLKNFE